mmetsp:Transcript_101809/g.265544  ORF Transcript_101809/g.265544 Transcript_101809/m.265544 type:complete len:217 (+) Transcript_101809:2221-2871(+)
MNVRAMVRYMRPVMMAVPIPPARAKMIGQVKSSRIPAYVTNTTQPAYAKEMTVRSMARHHFTRRRVMTSTTPTHSSITSARLRSLPGPALPRNLGSSSAWASSSSWPLMVSLLARCKSTVFFLPKGATAAMRLWATQLSSPGETAPLPSPKTWWTSEASEASARRQEPKLCAPSRKMSRTASCVARPLARRYATAFSHLLSTNVALFRPPSSSPEP